MTEGRRIDELACLVVRIFTLHYHELDPLSFGAFGEALDQLLVISDAWLIDWWGFYSSVKIALFQR